MIIDRRQLLKLGALALLPAARAADPSLIRTRDGIPCVDYHAHMGEGITLDRAIEIAKQRGITFGVLQHAGRKGHGYAVSDDDELRAWIKSVQGKPVFCGIEGEGTDWRSAFSADAVAQLDYVQSDPLAFPDKAGKIMRLWDPNFQCDNPQEFMARYTDFHVQLISTLPIDILAVPSFLPRVLQPDYDKLWTSYRTQAVIDACVKYNVALEIETRFRVPSYKFLSTAKAAGVKFAFGSNYQTIEGLGDISYPQEMYKRLGLKMKNFFQPAPAGQKPIQVR